MNTADFLKTQTPKQLLQLTGTIIDTLVARGICRTANNPVSDYTEWLVCKTLNLTRETSSKQGYDAVGNDDKKKYEIKARRLSKKNGSRQLSAIRDIDGEHFDFVVAVIYNAPFEVMQVLKIPREVIKRSGVFRKHTNSYTVYADAKMAGHDGVEDITNKFVPDRE